MIAALNRVTWTLGRQRRLVRRVAALCLLVLGVHMAADHLDDVVYAVLDALDLWLDDTAAAFLAWLSQAGGLAPEDALKASESFATAIDLAEKDRLALWLALGVELLFELLLLDLAWGRHVDEPAQGLLGELRASGRQMIAALQPLDLERFACMPTLFAFALGGATVAALAVENLVRDLIGRAAPEFLWGGSVAATLGILAAALLVWRFAPDLLHGALLRSQVRGERAREKAKARIDKPHRFPRLSRFLNLSRVASRGAWLVALALPLAAAGLLSSDLPALVARAIPTP